ncbi:ImpA domain protein [compost metagenome]
MKTEQPLWGRGIMVSPQHFQQQATYAAWSAECIARMGLNHPWGMIESAFEPDALKLGRLQARKLHVRFPDGTLIDTDNADALPPVLSLDSESHDVVVLLALPLLRANGGNCLQPDEVADRPVRFRQRWRDVRNQFGEDTRQIAVMQPELTLRFAHQNNGDYLTCPVARLQQDLQGVWRLDDSFLPPLLPATLTPEQLDMLRQQSPLPQTGIAQTQQQLARLDKLPPDWNIAYSRQLVEQAQALWPEQAKPLVQQWQRQLNAAGIPTENLNGWHQGMTKLQQLSDRLSGLDEQKGKYMTVSELKSVVFSTMQSFNQSIPAEEQLRALSANPAGEPLPVAGRAQLEVHLKQLTARYAEIKLKASK